MTNAMQEYVLNIPLSKCYLPLSSYRNIALEESCKTLWYDKYVFTRSSLLKKKNGQLTLSLPKQIYEMIDRYLSTKSLSFSNSNVCRFKELTVGDIYLNIPRLRKIPRCGEGTARTILYAFILLKNRMADFGVELDISHWEAEFKR